MTVLDRNADAGRALFASLPDDVANVVIQPRRDGSVALPNWFFEMLHSSSREEQAMIYLRETFLAQVRARQAEVNPKPSNDRLVQLFEELQDDPTGAYRKDFMTLLLTSKSVKEWREAVNRRFVFDRAPMLAFYRDSGTFDPADTTGGWQLTAPGALQRQALRDLSTRSVSFMSEAAMTDGNLKVDGKLVRQMLANPKDARWTQLRKILDQASSLSTGIGPAEMKRAAFAAGYGFSGGLTLFMDRGVLVYEYNMMIIERFQARSARPIAAGKHVVTVETTFESPKQMAPATVVLKVDDEEVGKVVVARTVPAAFTASETFGVGVDLGSPVSPDYFDRRPFRFEGRIERVDVEVK